MLFDSFAVVLLELRADAPKLDKAATEALQDAHLSYLADLHDAGSLLACGPLLTGPPLSGSPHTGRAFYGLNLFGCDPDTALRLCEQDPAVQAGRFRPVVQPWAVPGGAMSFTHTRLPRSMADLDDD